MTAHPAPPAARARRDTTPRFEVLHSAPGAPGRRHTASDATVAAWRDFLSRADFACHYVAPEFFDEIQFTTREPFAILVWEGDRVVAVASGIREGRTAQCGLCSRPQLSVDPEADRGLVARGLAAALVQVHQTAQRVSLVAWTPMPELTKAGYREHVHTGDASIVLLDLRRGPDALFKEFSESRRANVRKAIRRGIVVDEARSDEDIATYYEIYVDWSRRKQQPILEFLRFRDLILARANRRLFLAKHEGTIVAGVIVRFHPGGVIEYAANSSRKADQSLRPNDLLHWRVIEWACAQGLTTYSLGGAHLFLRRFGGTIINTYEYRFDRTFGKRFELQERLVDVARWSWHHLPEPLRTRLTGSHGAPAQAE